MQIVIKICSSNIHTFVLVEKISALDHFFGDSRLRLNPTYYSKRQKLTKVKIYNILKLTYLNTVKYFLNFLYKLSRIQILK